VNSLSLSEVNQNCFTKFEQVDQMPGLTCKCITSKNQNNQIKIFSYFDPRSKDESTQHNIYIENGEKRKASLKPESGFWFLFF
jgi:hypothetical protein